MALDVLDVSDLADFTGRDETTFVTEAQADTALNQATLLFRLATCLEAWPADDGSVDFQLAQFGVLAMADAIFLGLKYTTTLAKPFQSETIGSYSYSKAAGAVANRLPTGVTWFDMATDVLAVCEGGATVMGSSIAVFEHDGITTHDGKQHKLGPRDFRYSGWPFGGDAPDGGVYYREGYLAPWWVTTS